MVTPTRQKILLVWSGGLDSTALLVHLLSNNYEVETVYIDIHNNYIKSHYEQHARKQLKQLVEKKFNCTIKDKVIEIPQIKSKSRVKGFSQPFMWLYGLFFSISPADRYNYVVMGYIKGDDFWHIKHEFLEVYKNLWLCRCTSHNTPAPTLWFPFEWESKEKIFEDHFVTTFGKKLLRNVWTCERPKRKKKYSRHYKQCGKCLPCIKLRESKVGGIQID